MPSKILPVDFATSAPKKRRHAMTLEGLADVDAGRLVTQREMEDWVGKLEEKVSTGSDPTGIL